MTKPRVLISDKMDPNAARIFTEMGCDVDVITGETPEQLIARIGDYDGLAIRSSTKVTKAILDAATNLKVIQNKRGADSIGGLGSVLGSIFGAIFVILLPIVIRYAMEAFGGIFFAQQTVLNLIPALRLTLFGALIIVFLVVEPEGLNRLWRNIRSYFRVWPFAY